MPLIRAITVTWLFSGLRSDELSRMGRAEPRTRRPARQVAADFALLAAAVNLARLCVLGVTAAGGSWVLAAS